MEKFGTKFRTKKICKHPNPLFEKWLKEWKDDAERHGSNMKFNFQRAIKSLQKYPLPLYSGKDCLLLAHFGNKICELIDKKIEEYTGNNGPINWEDYIEIIDCHEKKSSKGRKRKKVEKSNSFGNSNSLTPQNKSNRGKKYIPVYRSGAYALLVGLHKAEIKDNYPGFLKKDDLIDIAQHYCDASFTVPPLGSHYTCWSSMSTLIKRNLVNKSGNPAKYWLTESGKSLAEELQRNDCSRSISPQLQQNEINSRTKLNSVNDDFLLTSQTSGTSSTNSTRTKFSSGTSSTNSTKTKFSSGTSSTNSTKTKFSSGTSSTNSTKTKFSSGTSSTNSNNTKFSAPNVHNISSSDDDDLNEISIIEDDNTSFRPNISSLDESDHLNESFSPLPNFEFLEDDLNIIDDSGRFVSNNSESFDTKGSLVKSPLKDEFQTNDPIEEITLIDDDNDDMAIDTPLNNSQQSTFSYSNKVTENLKFTYVDSSEMETNLKDNALVKIDETEGSLQFLIKCRLIDLIKSSLPYENDDTRVAPPGYMYAFLHDSVAPESSSFGHVPPHSTKIGNKKSRNTSSNSSTGSTSALLDSKSKQPDTITMPEESISKSSGDEYTSAVPVFTLFPQQYKIVLCVDNSEVTGGFSGNKKGSRDIIISALKSNGIDCDVRNLNVGDFLWICQEKSSTGDKPREVVLPYIIERKRMDDLACSIKDGRFKEQKFRLTKSGLPHRIYLVEEIGSNYSSLPLATCQQAITNTQVFDGFTVKITADQRESAAYLTVMTRYIQGKFRDKVSKCFKMQDLHKDRFVTSCNINGPSFIEFNSFSLKNQALSIQEMFAKHLLQLYGLSVDKVAAIIEKYPTPSILRKAIQDTPINDREDLLSAIKCLQSGRPIGRTLSSQIVRLYSFENLS